MPYAKTKIPTIPEILEDERYRDLAQLLKGLHENWQPTPKQAEVGRKIFAEGKRRVFIEAGRKWGKSEFAAYLCWRLGNTIQKGQIYYFGAYAKAVREIIWASNRLQGLGPQKYIKQIHKNDMRLTFTTDTFVKCDGADEFKVSKGFTPDVVILDEFADYSPEFWQAMSPNFIPKDTIVIIISSPPWVLENSPGDPVLFVKLADAWKKTEAKAKAEGKFDKRCYVHGTIYDNIHLSPEAIEDEKQELYSLGMEEVWQREYLAKRVLGGGKRIIATFNRTNVIPHAEMLRKIEEQRDELDFIASADPSHSAFGHLLVAVNPYTKWVGFIDEILEIEESESTEHALWPRISAQITEVLGEAGVGRFFYVCDEAAKWWIVGCYSDPEIGVNYDPTEKATNDNMYGLSLLRTGFLWRKMEVSDRCKHLIFQLENYRKTRNGQIPKKDDDLIDAGRYALHKAGYILTPEDRPQSYRPHIRETMIAQRRSPENDIEETMGALFYDPSSVFDRDEDTL